MYFAAMCYDKKDGLETRLANRDNHLAYLGGKSDHILLGGPFLADDGKTPIGSLLIFDVENEAAVHAILDNDPYTKAGLFENVDVKPWAWSVKNPNA